LERHGDVFVKVTVKSAMFRVVDSSVVVTVKAIPK